jgi:hypothetical protein
MLPKFMQKLLDWFKNYFPKYLLGAILIIVPLFPKFPLFSVPGTYVAIRFEDLLLLLMGIIVLIKILGNPKNFFKDEIIIAFTIFFAINLISILSGVLVTKTINLRLGLLNYARRLEYLIPFFAILTLFNRDQIKENLHYFSKILVIIILVAFVYGFGQRYFYYPIITTQNDTYSKGVALRWTDGAHISSTFAGHYDMAAYMVMMLPIFITLLFTLKGKWNRVWMFLTAGGGLWLLVNSLSRISQVSYLVAVTIALLLARKFKALVVVLVVSILVIGQSSSLNARFMRVFDVYYQKIKAVKQTSLIPNFVVHAETQVLPSLRLNTPVPTTTPVPVFEDRSTSIRLNVEWPAAIRAFNVNPLLGTGYSSIGLATDNDFLRMLGETGLLGFFAFILIFTRIGKLFIKAYLFLDKFSSLEKGFVIGTFSAIVGTFISAFFIDLFEASKFATIFWFMIGYSIYLMRNYANKNNID